ncbi:MAG: hypothetical protein JST58_08800 [Bacteroidetes bacterium]|nr:hypothetical protein [Bacteroidota bacterium]
MKAFKIFVFLLYLTRPVLAQYYYQDIITEKQVADKWKLYKQNRVKSVNVLSFESDNKPTEHFECYQIVKSDFSQIATYTKSDLTREATITTQYNANGQPIKTTDTSKGYRSITEYRFNRNGQIIEVNNSSSETIDNIESMEQHFWKYDQDGKPDSLLIVKNATDTSYTYFVKDEKGNIVEEHTIHKKIEAPFTYYYYDDNNQLTDIVRYNDKARKLLPIYIFTYNEVHQLSSMIFVQEGSSDYNTWVYQYNDAGLRTKETCFSKQRQMLGKIEYEYSFSR